MTLTAIKVPEWVHLRALFVLQRYRAHQVKPSRIRGSGNLSLRINLRWRLLSRNGGQHWEVMSHEKYNGAKDRK